MPSAIDEALLDLASPRALPWYVVLLLAVALTGGCTKTPDQLLRSAGQYRDKGDFTSAIIELKLVLSGDPDNFEGVALLGLSYAEIGEALDAERWLRRSLELGAPHERVLATLGRVLIDTEQYQEALTILRRGRGLSGESLSEVLLLAGRAHIALKQLPEARAVYQQAGVSKPAEAKLGLARIAMAENERKSAHKLIDDVLAGAPKNVEAWIDKGDALRGDAKHEEALKAYQQASALAPAHIVARVSQAMAYINLGKYAEARSELVQAQKRAPAHAMVRFTLASLALRERKFHECADNLAAVLRLIPRHMPSLLLKGAMHFASDQLQLAEATLSAYLRLEPGRIYARKMLAAVLMRRDQPQSAVHLLEPMIPLVEGDAELLALTGEAYMQLGRTRKARDYYERAVAIDPDNVRNRTQLGLAQINTGDPQKGVAELESAIALSPEQSRVDHMLVMALLGLNQIDKAWQAVLALEKRRPDKPDMHFLKAAVYRAKQDWAAARASYETVLKQQPNSFAATASLAQLDVQDKKPDTARARMEALLKLDPRKLDALLFLALIEGDAGREAESIRWLRKATGDHPNAMLPYALLAEALRKEERFGDALGAAQKARELSPKDPRVAELIGDIQRAAGNKDAAITAYAVAVQLQPLSVTLQIKLAEAFAANGNLRESGNIIRRTLLAAPHSVSAQIALAEHLMRSADYAGALALAKQIQEQTPERPPGYLLEGEIGMGQQNYARAAAAFEKADSIEANGLARVRLHQARSRLGKNEAPDANLRAWIKSNPEDVSTRFYLAEIERRAGRSKAAIEQYQAILKLKPRHLPTLNNLALALHREGDPKATHYAVQAFQMKPDDARLADTAGWIMVEQGKVTEGLLVLTKAIALDEQNPEIRFHLAQALAKSGDTARARKELALVLASKKSFPQIEQARTLMQHLASTGAAPR